MTSGSLYLGGYYEKSNRFIKSSVWSSTVLVILIKGLTVTLNLSFILSQS